VTRGPDGLEWEDEGARRRGILISLASAVVTVVIALIIAAAAAWFALYGSGPSERETTVLFRKGAGVGEIAAALERKNVIASADIFRVASQFTGADRKLKAGEYNFPAGVRLAEVLRKMAAGQVVRHFVTVPEGRTSAQVVVALNAQQVLVGEVDVPPEGSILPDTYEVMRGETRADVLTRMRAARDALLAELWDKRAPNLPIKTPEEAIILASIVEKETGVASERARVAAIFVNRLNKGMRLESDPTIIYSITKGEPLRRGIRQSELLAVTPYNSYQVAGLPPTPIANPGKAAIIATLHPATTDDIYFVADGSGGHAFASTLAVHQQNVIRWRQIEAKRNAEQAQGTGR
jgi:UPF0755 protein